MTTLYARPGDQAFDLDRLQDYRRRAAAFTSHRRSEPAVDRALSDSFPASDSPPWTLGVSRSSATPETGQASPDHRGSQLGRMDRPRWWAHLVNLGGAVIVALGFSGAILLVGSLLALAVRLGLEAVTRIAGYLAGAAG